MRRETAARNGQDLRCTRCRAKGPGCQTRQSSQTNQTNQTNTSTQRQPTTPLLGAGNVATPRNPSRVLAGAILSDSPIVHDQLQRPVWTPLPTASTGKGHVWRSKSLLY